MKRRSMQAGLSLIELMIAVTLGLILMTGVTQIFISSKVVFTTQQGLSRIQETGRLAIDFLSRDISAAGYYGCYKPIPTPTPNPTPSPNMLNGTPLIVGGLHGNFEIGVRGFDSIADLPKPSVTEIPTDNLGESDSSVTPIPNNSIVVVHAASEEGFSLSNASGDHEKLEAVVPAGTQLTSGDDPCVGNICANSAAVISDCSQARVFLIPAGSDSLSLSETLLTVKHDKWDPFNPLVNGLDGATFIADAELRPMNTTVYFLGTRPGSVNASLWQRKNLSPPVELLEGIEAMSITYSTTNNATFRTATEIDNKTPNDWARVNAVRVELVVRSLANNVVADPQPYTFKSHLIDPGAVDKTDRHMRQVFITTIAKRNVN